MIGVGARVSVARHEQRSLLMPGFIGFPELIVLGLVVLLIFGPKRLPEMGRSLGHGMREFKDSITSSDREPTPLTTETRPAEAHPHERDRVA
jgi:sec-independent protein translocase protein TatA